MTDTELLVHRFIDQELGLEERVAFVARLARDAAFRDEVLAFEQLILGASRLPRPAVPAGFVNAVLARTAPERAGWSRVRAGLLARHTFHWNLAGVSAVACVVLLVVAGLNSSLGAPANRGASASASAPASTKVLVRFVIVQPGAETVQVAGDFNGWDAARTPLEPLAGGAWAVTIPLDPGRYEYMFVVNGRQWVADPFAAERSDDGFGAQNAVLDVRQPAGAV